MKKNKILNILITITIGFLVSYIPVNAQSTTNLLTMHTGKSYILDFPIKVTRVVGGDPSAIELNLFKKKELEGEVQGYQLLIAPIAEKNTNIIVWTDLGLYVFDVVIDNSSPYTAETIVLVPKDAKKFIIPIAESTQNPVQNINSDELDMQNLTSEVEDGLDKVEYQVKDQFDKVEKEKEKEPSESIEDLVIDQPPEPELVPPVKLKKKKQPETKTVKKKPENMNNNKFIEKEKTIKQEIKEEKKEEIIEINLKPQASKKFDLENSLDEKAETMYSGKLSQSKDDLKLTVSAVNLVDKSFVIHLSLKNSSDQVKYLLWDLTRVTDAKGTRFIVRNKDLPPGIVYPGKDLKGSILAIPKSKSMELSNIKTLHLALLNTEGEILLSTEIPLSNNKW